MVDSKKLALAGIIALLIMMAVLLFAFKVRETSEIHRDDTSTKEEMPENNADTELPDKVKKKIKYWVAPMDPTYVRSKPGKSPMGMDLVPVYEDGSEESAEGTVRIDPVTVQSMGVRTAKVARGPLKTSIRTIGRVTYDEERVEHIHTKISGWVEQLFIKTTGENISSGQEILSIYSPELVATQQEYLQALSYRDKVSGSSFTDVVSGAESLLESTKKRLLLMDISPDQIKSLEDRGEVQREIILRSQTSGIVIEKRVFEGMKVNPGMELYIIADLSRVWVIASVYEYELPFLKVGQETIMSLPYEPGTTYRGKVTFIYPYLSPKTRTVQVRMEFDNPDLKLKPDMYADVIITTETARNVLLVPSEAILRTGYRNVIITSLGNGKFLPKEVKMGPEGEGMTQIMSGIAEGETIVTSGQFLIDSESNLKEAINKMLAAQAAESSLEKPDKKGNEQEQTRMPQMNINNDQKNMITALIEHYLIIHGALVAEEVSEVAGQTRIMSGTLGKMKATEQKGQLKEITASMEHSFHGLQSGNLQKARNAFKLLSRAMVNLVKGTGREEALSSGIKIYYCPMEKERWLQTGSDLKNPYLGKDMWICGNEEKL